jgi:hypothetical protein
MQQLTVKTVQYRASKENKIGPMVIRWIVYSIVSIIFLLNLDNQRWKPATGQEVVATNRPPVMLKDSKFP